MADVVSGYTLTGDHDPDLWFVIRRGSADVGVVLLTEHRASKQAELLYMGLVPAARGDGIGRVAVRHAQRLACERRADRLVLAVDTRNSPARAAYANAGFFPWATRVVYTRPRPAAANG
ncbi:MAG: GNAT family N-acetyltransferase, partial [Planctomycetota bacterium]